MRKDQDVKKVYQQAHEHLNYDPLTGIFTWKTSNIKRSIGERAGTVHERGYRRFYLAPYTIIDSTVAYLMMTGEYHVFMKKIDGDLSNCKFNNLSPVKERGDVTRKYTKATKLNIMKCLDGFQLNLTDLAIAMENVNNNVKPLLIELVADRYLMETSSKRFKITPKGHQGLVDGRDFIDRDDSRLMQLFQIVLPGTLTGNEGRKELNIALR